MDKKALAILAILITCVSFIALGCTGASQSGTSQATATPQQGINGSHNDTYMHRYNGTDMQGYNGTHPAYNGTMMRGNNSSYNGTYMRGHNGTRPDFNGTMMNPNMPYGGYPDNSGQG